MILKALHSIKGLKPADEYTHAGETFEVDPAEGERLIALGSAEEVAEAAAEEPAEPTAAELEEPHH